MVDFLVIGTFNAVNYYDVFPLIKDGIINIGYNRVGKFTNGADANGIWYSTLYVEDRPPLDLVEYSGDYKEYDHFSAINIDRVCDIPNYDGVMGVPVTFLEKWCRMQFKILDARDYRKDERFKNMEVQMLSGSGGEMSAVEGIKKYGRLLIKKR